MSDASAASDPLPTNAARTTASRKRKRDPSVVLADRQEKFRQKMEALKAVAEQAGMDFISVAVAPKAAGAAGMVQSNASTPLLEVLMEQQGEALGAAVIAAIHEIRCNAQLAGQLPHKVEDATRDELAMICGILQRWIFKSFPWTSQRAAAADPAQPDNSACAATAPTDELAAGEGTSERESSPHSSSSSELSAAEVDGTATLPDISGEEQFNTPPNAAAEQSGAEEPGQATAAESKSLPYCCLLRLGWHQGCDRCTSQDLQHRDGDGSETILEQGYSLERRRGQQVALGGVSMGAMADHGVDRRPHQNQRRTAVVSESVHHKHQRHAVWQIQADGVRESQASDEEGSAHSCTGLPPQQVCR